MSTDDVNDWKEIEIASGARVRIKALNTLAEMKHPVDLQREIWGYGEEGQAYPYPKRCLFEFVESGGLVGCAYVEERPVGFSAAWIGWDKKLKTYYLHSQLVGLIPEYQNSGIGYHFKLQQREYAQKMGLHLIKWTFDPTKTRNAYLNLRKLGGITRTYTRDYYGNLQSAFNPGLATDRFWVEWYVDSDHVNDRIKGKLDTPQLENTSTINRLQIDDDGMMHLKDYSLIQSTEQLLFELPYDFSTLAERNIAAARNWQNGLRDVFSHYFDSGYVVDDLWIKDDEVTKKVFYKLRKAKPEVFFNLHHRRELSKGD